VARATATDDDNRSKHQLDATAKSIRYAATTSSNNTRLLDYDRPFCEELADRYALGRNARRYRQGSDAPNQSLVLNRSRADLDERVEPGPRYADNIVLTASATLIAVGCGSLGTAPRREPEISARESASEAVPKDPHPSRFTLVKRSLA